MNVAVRRATLEDAEVLACLIRSSFRDVAERFDLDSENAPTHPSNCQPDWIRSDLRRGVSYYLACWSGSAAGCVALELSSPPVAYLERLGVLPEQRGRGLGTELVRHVLREARSAGARVVSAGVIAEHTELVAWYERLGFTQTETRRFPHLPFTVSYLEHVLS